MIESNALIFGYNDYTLEVQKSISLHYKNIQIFKMDEDDENSFDLSDEWLKTYS